MKPFLSIMFLLLMYGFAEAQIGEVKVVGNQAKIYDEDAKYTYHSISMNSTAELADYNSKFIVIVEGNQAKNLIRKEVLPINISHFAVIVLLKKLRIQQS